MKKIKTFLYVLRRTFTSLDYYADILKAPFGFSLKFFWMFFFFFALVFTSWFTLRHLLPVRGLLEILPAKLVEVYPAELEVTIKNGQVTTNVAEPYQIPLERLKEIFEEIQKRVLGANTEQVDNLLVIDTNGRIDDFARYRTYVLLTKNNLTYINDQGNLEVISLSKVGDLTVNQKTLKNLAEIITPYLKYLIPLLAGLTFVSCWLFYSSSRLFYLLFGAFILLLVSKLVKFPLSYKKSYQLGLHLIVVSTTVFSLLALAGVAASIPFAQTIFLTILGTVVIRKIKTLQKAKS